MLILTRRVGQSIMIGEDITITITAVDGRGQPTVRVGIAAPKHMRVDREEVRAAINREKTTA